MTAYKNMSATEKQTIEEQYRMVWHDDERMVSHCVKTTSNYFTSDDGIIVDFEKPTIQTSFWFGEHGYDYEEMNETAHAASKSVEFFKRKNFANLESYRKAWGECEHYTSYRYPYIKRGAYCTQDDACMLGCIEFANCAGESHITGRKLEAEGFRKLTEGEIERLRDAENRRNALFEKRLDAYLKRYGLSKVQCSTYWADR